MMWPRSFVSFGRIRRCSRGTSAVEFGLIAPILGAFAVALFEYFGATHQAMQLGNAARVGAEYAMAYPSDIDGIREVVLNSGGISPDGLSIVVNQTCECPDGTSVTCGDTCGNGAQSNVFMGVALSQPARSILAASGAMPGYTLNASAVMRVR